MAIIDRFEFSSQETAGYLRRKSARAIALADLSADWKRWNAMERLVAMTFLFSVLATSSLAAINGI